MATVFYESASELARLSNTFTVGGTATDPTTVTLAITTPSGTATSYTYAAGEITKSSTGVYTKDISCSEDGEWSYTWTGTGAASDAQHGTWTVFPTDLGKLYAPVDALKSRLGLSDTADDYELHSACFAASRAVEQHCQRLFYRSASATVRTFVADNPYRVSMPPFSDLVSVSALKTDSGGDGTFETTWDADDYQLWPVNPAAAPEQLPYTSIRAVGSYTFPCPTGVLARDDRVQVTGVFGWPSVPWAVREATLIKAHRLFRRKGSPEGVAGVSDFGVVRVSRFEDPDVVMLLAPYAPGPLVA